MPDNVRPGRQYRKPPITEAVIDFRFKGDLDDKDLNRAQRALQGWYPQVQRMQNITLEGRPTGVSQVGTDAGFRLTAEDGQRVVLLSVSGVALAYLAPYPGWETFRERAWEVMRRLRKKLGVRPLGRMSVRYINRIDLPEKISFNTFDYVRFGPSNPAARGPTGDYYCNIVNQFADDPRFRSVLQTGVVPSPLMDRMSLLLDVDVLCEAELPNTEEGLLEMLDLLRAYKNTIFEDCITDRARAIFEPI